MFFLILSSVYAATGADLVGMQQQELGFNIFIENVGQGNGLVVVDNTRGKRLVVDAGSSKYPVSSDETLQHFSSKIQHQPQYLSSNPIIFIASHPDKDHLNLFAKLLERIETNIQSNKNIKFYLGGPFAKYLTSKDAEAFLSKILGMHNSQIVSLSHDLTKDEMKKIHENLPASKKQFQENFVLGFEDIGAAISRTVGLGIRDKVRPFILHSIISEFSENARVNTEIVSANAGHALSRAYPVVGADSSNIISFETDPVLRPSEIVNPDDNTSSIVLRIVFFNNLYSILVTGDATGITTDRLLRNYPDPSQSKTLLESDLVLACHHGSITEESNNAEWVSAVKPKHVIFSSAKFEGYHHPQFDAFWNYLNSPRISQAKKVHNFLCARKSDRPLQKSPYVLNPVKNSTSGDYNWYSFQTNKSIYSTFSSGHIKIHVSPVNAIEISTEE